MDEHEKALAALEGALERFLATWDDWLARGAPQDELEGALGQARRELEAARGRLSDVERLRASNKSDPTP